MRIEDVDVRDERAFAAWFAVVDAAERHDRDGERRRALREVRQSALHGRPDDDGTPPAEEQVEQLLARDVDGRAVGAARIELPLSDNAHVLWFELSVLPAALGAGDSRRTGRALLAAAVRRAVETGRSTLMTEVDEPPAVQGRSAGRELLAAAGFREALVGVRRDLALPVSGKRLDAVEAGSRSRAQGYGLVTWRGRSPEALLADRAELARQMSLDVPLGDLSWREEAWDAGRVRRREDLLARQGRTPLGAGALSPEGRLVAFTEVVASVDLPERLEQWETFVLAAHRGRRLGALVKTAVLRRVPAELPQARLVVTTNADVNAPMIAVNEALGFRPNGLLVAFERATAV